jgi:hypothetical protein
MKDIAEIIKEQIGSYEKHFRKNKNREIEDTLSLLRSIVKHPWYMDEFGDSSFREDLVSIVQTRAVNRYGKISEECTAPPDASEEDVLQGLITLGDTIMTEMDQDFKHYQKGFSKYMHTVSRLNDFYLTIKLGMLIC